MSKGNEGGYSKIYLHTGDMRYHPKMKNYAALQNIKIDKIFLDTTYAHPKHKVNKRLHPPIIHFCHWCVLVNSLIAHAYTISLTLTLSPSFPLSLSLCFFSLVHHPSGVHRSHCCPLQSLLSAAPPRAHTVRRLQHRYVTLSLSPLSPRLHASSSYLILSYLHHSAPSAGKERVICELQDTLGLTVYMEEGKLQVCVWHPLRQEPSPSSS